MNRRRFLKVGGSVVVGTLFVGGVGHHLWKMLTRPEELFYAPSSSTPTVRGESPSDYVSPYRLTFGFELPDDVQSISMTDEGELVLSTPNNIWLYGLDGRLHGNFAVRSDVRDVAVYDHRIYLLYPSQIEVYDLSGEQIAGWRACSEDADYCFLTVFSEGVYVTDAGAKNICRYDLEGTLRGFIQSPAGFVVPSYSFGITHLGSDLFCSNPGRHQVEQYTADGEFVRSFGRSGTEAGAFSGCCNPVHLTTTAAGELLTSEKGIPRISCYSPDGQFRSVLLDSKALGGGHQAYDLLVSGDKLVVTSGKKVSVFQYDDRRASGTLCGSCTVDCPMKV